MSSTARKSAVSLPTLFGTLKALKTLDPLVRIDELEVLPKLFGRIVIPTMVEAEAFAREIWRSRFFG